MGTRAGCKRCLGWRNCSVFGLEAAEDREQGTTVYASGGLQLLTKLDALCCNIDQQNEAAHARASDAGGGRRGSSASSDRCTSCSCPANAMLRACPLLHAPVTVRICMNGAAILIRYLPA